jgi:hypothetical protein
MALDTMITKGHGANKHSYDPLRPRGSPFGPAGNFDSRSRTPMKQEVVKGGPVSSQYLGI